MLLDNIHVDYYPCYDKAWSIVEFEFFIWTSIYFGLTYKLIAPHLIDVMSWALIWVCLFDYDYEPCCYPFLGSHKKKIENEKIQKIFERNPKNNRSERRTGMLKKKEEKIGSKGSKMQNVEI